MEQKITKKILIDEYYNKNKSLLQISKDYNIPYTSLNRLFHKYNLKVRKNNISKDYLIKEYNKKLSQQEIANDLNLNVSVIQRHFKKYNLKSRKNIIGKEHHSYKHGLYSEKTNSKNCTRHRKLIDKNIKCEICKQTKKDMDIHHIDFNHLNNNKNNLQILCHSCHSTLHRNFEWSSTRSKEDIKRDNKGRFSKNDK